MCKYKIKYEVICINIKVYVYEYVIIYINKSTHINEYVPTYLNIYIYLQYIWLGTLYRSGPVPD